MRVAVAATGAIASVAAAAALTLLWKRREKARKLSQFCSTVTVAIATELQFLLAGRTEAAQEVAAATAANAAADSSPPEHVLAGMRERVRMYDKELKRMRGKYAHFTSADQSTIEALWADSCRRTTSEHSDDGDATSGGGASVAWLRHFIQPVDRRLLSRAAVLAKFEPVVQDRQARDFSDDHDNNNNNNHDGRMRAGSPGDGSDATEELDMDQLQTL